MKNYYVFNPVSGAILRRGNCLDQDIELQGHDGEVVAEGEITNENFIIDGVPFYVPPPPPTPEEVAEKEEIRFQFDVVRVLGKAVFNHENRIRVLEGKPEVTWEQFKTYIRGMI